MAYNIEKPSNSSSSKRSSSIGEITVPNKRAKNKPETEKSPKENVVNNLIVNATQSNAEDSIDHEVATKEKLLWNDNWFTFKQAPKLEEMKIDTESTLKWCPNYISNEEGNALFRHLMEELNFEHSSISMFGKAIKLPRLQSWFADEGLVVKELYQKQKQHLWTIPMQKLKDQLEKQLCVRFDYCLVNLYRNGNDHINFHADHEANDIIASISLGAKRRFLVRHLSCFDKDLTRKRKSLTQPEKKEYEFSLNNGSLIVMIDGTQQYWKHSVPREKKITNPRINLTFRTVQS